MTRGFTYTRDEDAAHLRLPFGLLLEWGSPLGGWGRGYKAFSFGWVHFSWGWER